MPICVSANATLGMVANIFLKALPKILQEQENKKGERFFMFEERAKTN